MRARILRLAAICASAACGKDATTPPPAGTPTLEIVAGAEVADTIGVIPAQPLVVRLRNPALAGETVNFDVGPSGCPWSGYCAHVLLAGPTGTTLADAWSTETDAGGEISTRVRLGDVAGPGIVIVSVPRYGLVDTVRYTALPGATAYLTLGVRDTVVEAGTTFRVRAGVTDRAGNLRPDPIAYEAASPGLQVDATGNVTAVDPGVAYVRVRATIGGATRTDSAGVTIVPAGRFAIVGSFGSLRLQRLTGDTGRIIVSGDALEPDWSPDGERIAYANGQGIFVSDTLGHATALPAPGTGGPAWPRFSADGQWIYFQANTFQSSGPLYRIHPDGSGLQPLLRSDSVALEGGTPAPAPDGSRVAFATGGEVHVLTLATGQVATIYSGNSVSLVTWSPDGQWIACVDGGGLHLLHPDGSGLRSPALTVTITHDLVWSPDSRWLIATGYYAVVAVNAATGLGYSLPIDAVYLAWRP